MSVTSKPLLYLQEDFVTSMKLVKVRVIYNVGDTKVVETVSSSDPSVRQAVKHIRFEDSNGRAKNTREIDAELAVWRKVNHPHIVQIFCAGFSPGCFAYSMPFYPRGSLDRMCGNVEPHMLERYFVQAACAVRYLHYKKIVHGDIKPGNILIDDYDNAKICDFGHAKVLDQGTSTVSNWGGTEGYNGPELYLQLNVINAYLVRRIAATASTKATTTITKATTTITKATTTTSTITTTKTTKTTTTITTTKTTKTTATTKKLLKKKANI